MYIKKMAPYSRDRLMKYIQMLEKKEASQTEETATSATVCVSEDNPQSKCKCGRTIEQMSVSVPAND